MYDQYTNTVGLKNLYQDFLVIVDGIAKEQAEERRRGFLEYAKIQDAR